MSGAMSGFRSAMSDFDRTSSDKVKLRIRLLSMLSGRIRSSVNHHMAERVNLESGIRIAFVGKAKLLMNDILWQRCANIVLEQQALYDISKLFSSTLWGGEF